MGALGEGRSGGRAVQGKGRVPEAPTNLEHIPKSGTKNLGQTPTKQIGNEIKQHWP